MFRITYQPLTEKTRVTPTNGELLLNTEDGHINVYNENKGKISATKKIENNLNFLNKELNELLIEYDNVINDILFSNSILGLPGLYNEAREILRIATNVENMINEPLFSEAVFEDRLEEYKLIYTKIIEFKENNFFLVNHFRDSIKNMEEVEYMLDELIYLKKIIYELRSKLEDYIFNLKYLIREIKKTLKNKLTKADYTEFINEMKQKYFSLVDLYPGLVGGVEIDNQPETLPDVNYFTVYFHTFNGTYISSKQVPKNTLVNRPTNPTKDGYLFGSWYSDTSFNKEWNFSTNTVTKNMTLYSKWVGQGYIVSFNTNGGDVIQDQAVVYNGYLSRPLTPLKVGYTFMGWFEDNITFLDEWSFNSDKINKNMTLYAKWSNRACIIKFNTNLGSYIEDLNIAYNDYVIKPADPSRNGYEFAGWYTDNNTFVDSWIFETERATTNMTLYAKWVLGSGYTITFNTNGGNVINPQIIPYNDYVIKPVDPIKDGNKFINWYSDSSLTTLWNFSTSVVKGNMTIYAKWDVNVFTISFKPLNDTTLPNEEVPYDNLIPEPPTPTKQDYVFSHWDTEGIYNIIFDSQGGSSVENQLVPYDTLITKPTDPTKEDYILSYWSTVPMNESFTVVFETSGGTSIPTQVLEYGRLATIPNIIPIKSGFDFNGWYVDNNYSSLFDFNTPIIENIIIYGKWDVKNNVINVLFNTQGGNIIPNQVIEYNTSATIPTTPTKSNSAFINWYTDLNYTTIFNFSTLLTSDITLYAKWETNKLTVVFNTQGGNIIPNQVIDYNTSATIPTTPTKENASFINWYTDLSYTTIFNFTTKLTSSITLYAKWNVNKVTVKFDTQGGNIIPDQLIDYDTYALNPTTPTKANYSFGGWYTTNTFETIWNFSTKIKTNMTLYTKWLTTKYTIVFDERGGTSKTPNQYLDLNQLVLEPNIPIRTGADFNAWYTSDKFTKQWNFLSDRIIGSMTLFANWSVDKFTVNFDTVGATKLIDPQLIEYKGYVKIPTTPVRTGYDFDGWFTDSIYTKEWVFTTAITTSMTLYAKWNIKKFIITFTNPGDKVIASQEVPYNSYVTNPGIPIKEKYEFLGWYPTTGTTTTQYNFSTPVTGNLTLNGKWKALLYVKFYQYFTTNTNPSLIKTIYIKSGEYVPHEPPAIRDTYQFINWSTYAVLDSTAGTYTRTEFNFSSPITTSKALYGYWKRYPYINYSNCTKVTEYVNPDNPYIIDTSDPIKAGYYFIGWYTTSTYVSGTEWSIYSPVTKNDTVYAKWQKI